MVKVNPESQLGEGTIWFDYFLATDPLIGSSSSKSKNIGAIVGSIIGGIIFLIIVALAISLVTIALRRRKRRQLEHVQPFTGNVQSVVTCCTSFLKSFSYILKTFGTRGDSLHSSHFSRKQSSTSLGNSDPSADIINCIFTHIFVVYESSEHHHNLKSRQ